MKAAERNKILRERNLQALRNSNQPPKGIRIKDPRHNKPANDPPLTDEQIETIRKETIQKLKAVRVSDEFLQSMKETTDAFDVLDRHPEDVIGWVCFILSVCITVILVDLTK